MWVSMYKENASIPPGGRKNFIPIPPDRGKRLVKILDAYTHSDKPFRECPRPYLSFRWLRFSCKLGRWSSGLSGRVEQGKFRAKEMSSWSLDVCVWVPKARFELALPKELALEASASTFPPLGPICSPGGEWALVFSFIHQTFRRPGYLFSIRFKVSEVFDAPERNRTICREYLRKHTWAINIPRQNRTVISWGSYMGDSGALSINAFGMLSGIVSPSPDLNCLTSYERDEGCSFLKKQTLHHQVLYFPGEVCGHYIRGIHD